MKPRRQEKIREIVEKNVIETQEELTEFLRREHIKVTQATVSRDIKELMLVKKPMGGGRSRYALPESGSVRGENRLENLFRDAVTGVDASGNLVVVRTLPGMANAVASALDGAKQPDIIGTVAGDDTIFVAVRQGKTAASVAERMRALLSEGR